MYRIKTEWVGSWPSGRPRYQALVIRLSDGAVVWTSEPAPDVEQCWEDAARQCRQRGWKAGQ